MKVRKIGVKIKINREEHNNIEDKIDREERDNILELLTTPWSCNGWRLEEA